MPIPASKLVYDFNRKADALISGRKRAIPVPDVVAYLNEAQEVWYSHATEMAEIDERYRQDLRNFLVPESEWSVSSFEEYSIAKIPNNFYRRLNQRGIVTKECCPNVNKTIPIRILQSDDKNEVLRNEFTAPSFEWECLVGNESNRGFVVYHNDMTLSKVIVDYYRKLNPIHAPSLVECADGNYYNYEGTIISQDMPFEVDSTYIHNLITDLAVLMAKRDLGELQDYSARLQGLLNTAQTIKSL